MIETLIGLGADINAKNNVRSTTLSDIYSKNLC